MFGRISKALPGLRWEDWRSKLINYGVHGTFEAKITGLVDVYKYVTRTYDLPIRMRAPFDNLLYLAPRDGRSAPPDLRANDIAHWQTTMLVGDAEEAARRLFAARVLFVSPGAISLSGPALGFARGLLVREPDGHPMRLVQP